MIERYSNNQDTTLKTKSRYLFKDDRRFVQAVKRKVKRLQ